MLVSVLINNYNYGRFLSACIQSALCQDYPEIEIIVVDDGSTDNSVEAAKSFGPRIVLIEQQNSGQGGAYSTAFSRAKGEIVMFLDSDDLLGSHVVRQVVQSFRDPLVAKVQWRLQLIDEQGLPREGLFPDTLHSGDVRSIIRRFGNYASPPGSGNAYRKSALESFFPLEPDVWRIGADTLPVLCAPFSGKVVSLKEPGGSYRIHDKHNQGNVFVLNNSPAIPSKAVGLGQHSRDAVHKILVAAGLLLLPYKFEVPAQVKVRLISLRVAPEDHPLPSDSVIACLGDGYRSIIRWPGFTLKKRLLYLVWLTAVAFAPCSLAKKIILAGMQQSRNARNN